MDNFNGTCFTNFYKCHLNYKGLTFESSESAFQS